jgi:DNA-directed RNA polymerase specialized sigma24 family protein
MKDDLDRVDPREGPSGRPDDLDRRRHDQKLVRLLAQDGFKGPRYDRFEEKLARYGISVLRAWMHSGFIFRLVAERGLGLRPHERELEELGSNSDLREELATMTVACALVRFRQRALVEEGWMFEGGASITTYFMGACVYEFPNEFRRYRASEQRHRRALQRQQEMYESPVSPLSTADEVLGPQRVRDTLKEISDPRTRAALALALDGYTHEEIQELLDATSIRAIEGLLYRWRMKAKRDEEGEQRG